MIGIAIHQYGKERDLNEKYAFKATIAEVMRNHADFIIETSKKTGEENTAFIRETISNIYEDLFEKNIDVENVKKDTNKKAKIIDIVSKIKELKEIVPDQTVLKNIVDILVKFK
jgi:hypothetical protein